MTQTLSVVIPVLNEEKNLPRCLKALAWADEVIVMDGGSTDGTVALLRAFGGNVRVYEGHWDALGVQRNEGASHAQGDWILALDADEHVNPCLQESIEALLRANPGAETKAAYALSFRPYFLGAPIRFGDCLGETHVRLFKRGAAQFGAERLHESVQVNGETGHLPGFVEHQTCLNMEEFLSKLKAYSLRGAEDRAQKGETGSLLKAMVKSTFAFLRNYVFKGGFLDGKAGFLFACYVSHTVFYRTVCLQALGTLVPPQK